MSQQLAAENEGVLETIMQTGKKKVALQELISLILNREVSRKQAKLFLDARFGNQKIDWLQMHHDEIYELALQAKKFKKDNEEKWRQEKLAHERELQERELLRKEQERLRQEMIRKNMTREAMIKLVQESIEKCERIMLTSKDEEEYARLKKSVEDLRRELFILQGKFFEEMEVNELPENNDDEIDPELYKRIQAIKEKKLQEIEQARLEKQNKQRMRLEQIAKNLSNSKGKVQEIFQHYSQYNAVKGTTFEDRNKITDVIDLKLFLKFIKDFEVLSKTITIYEVTSIFKKTATNSIWMNLQQFQEFVFWLYKRQNSNYKLRQDQIDINFTHFLNWGLCNRSRIEKILNPIQKKQRKAYEYYTHSGLIKEDIVQQIQRRKQAKQSKKKQKVAQKVAAQSKKRSLSLPSIFPKGVPSNRSPTRTSIVTESMFLEKQSPTVKKPQQIKKASHSVMLTRKTNEIHPKQNTHMTETLHKSIYDQLKQFDNKYHEKFIQKLVQIKNDQDDQFLKELRKGRQQKKSSD